MVKRWRERERMKVVSLYLWIRGWRSERKVRMPRICWRREKGEGGMGVRWVPAWWVKEMVEKKEGMVVRESAGLY